MTGEVSTSARRDLLLGLAMMVSERRSLSEIFASFAESLLKVTPFTHASLAVLEADPRFLRVAGSFPASDQPPAGADIFPTRDSGIEAVSASEGGVEFVPAHVDVPSARTMADLGLRRAWSIALAHEGRKYGLFTVGRTTGTRFSDDELDFLRDAARLLTGAAVEETHVRDARVEAARNRILSELAILLGAGEPVEALFDRLQALLEQALDFDFMQLSGLAGPGLMRVAGATHPDVYRRPGDTYPAAQSGADEVLATGSAVAQYRSDRLETGWARAMSAAGFKRFIAAVLMQGDNVLGVLDIGRSRNLAFTPGDEAFARLVATLLAQAVGNSLRLELSQTESSRNRLLSELAVLLSAGEPIEAIFGRVRDLTGQALPFDYIGLAVEDGGGMLRVVGAEPPAMHNPGDRYPLAESQIGGVTGDGAAVVQFRTDRVPGEWPAAFARIGMTRMAVVVLRHRGDVRGLFSLGRRQNRAYTPEECAFLEIVGTLIGQATGNQARLAESEAEAHRGRVLNELSVLVNAGRPVDALFDSIRGKVRQALPFDFLALHIATANGFRLVGMEPDISIRASAERTPDEIGLGIIFVAGESVTEYRPADYSTPALRAMAGAGLECAISALLGEPGAPLGVLTFARRTAQPFAPGDVAFVTLLATFLAQAEANQRRVAEAEAEAEEQRVIAEVAALAASTLDAESIVREIVEPIRRFVPRPFVTLGFIDGNTVVYPTPGGEPESQPLSGHTTIADETGQSASAEPHPEIRGYEIFMRFGVHAMALTICTAAGAPVGYLVVGSRLEGYEFGERELRLLRLIAQIIGPAMANVMSAQRIARERATYNLALTSMKDAVMLIDREFKAVFTNPLGEKLADAIDPGRVLRTLESNLEALPQDVRDHFERAVTRHEQVSGRTQVSLAGIPAWFDFDFIPLDDPNLALLVVASDVTAEVRREEESTRHREEMEKAARLAALGELIGGVAHELNNPLTAILGFAELMAQSEPGESFDEEVGLIRKEALRARDIVRDLLFIARPGQVDRGDVLLADVAGHVERLRRPVWTQQGIEVTVDTAGVGAPLNGNEHQLTQVLLNLVTNAENAVRGNPQPRISIRARIRDENAVIEVEDNGHGMDPATRDRIFEPFFTTRQGDGTGLGLSLSYSIVAAHDGQMEVESTPGAGTVFRIVLPLRRSAVVVAAPPAPQPTHGRARALVVDDEPSLRVLSQRLISSMGHECAVAPDSATAIALAQEQEFDVVICDYRLATETADAVVAGFLRVAPGLVERTVIATGATTDPGVVDIVRRHNLRLIAKPYGVDEIANLLSEAAARRR